MSTRRHRPLKVGIQLPEVEREVRWPELLDMTRAIEDEGFDSVWVGEHLLYRWDGRPPRGPWEAWTLLAAIAASTSRIELGPLVACTNFHNPALLAKQAATIDELSGGRLILGLGAGWNDTDFRAFGYPFDHRIDRFEEAFTIIRTLLREGAIDFDGRWYQARDCELLPRGPRVEGPPLMIGSKGPRMLRATMAHADSWNVWFSDTENRPGGVPALRLAVDEACRDVGRDPAEVERTVAVQVQIAGGSGRVEGETGKRAVEPLTGSAGEIAETLRAFAREGIAHVQLVVDPITTESIRGLAAVLRELDQG
jgi:alkanesulfonate monooxygenase SsuD/methylene tetrahydromethanopterin reductase-like flavin-dependent oxidoreductase (luciferase family)